MWVFLCINHRHNAGMIYGYARISTDGQTVKATGADSVIREVANGAAEMPFAHLTMHEAP